MTGHRPESVGARLVSRGSQLAVAESCTGGLLAERLTAGAGASEFFAAGIVSYSNQAKQRLLGVGADLLKKHGAVSEPVARAMVDGVRRASGADAGLAITGVAGPGGGSPEKPVGTVWIAASLGDRTEARLFHFDGSRAEIRAASAAAALALLDSLLEEDR